MDERISYIEKNDKRRRDERERKIRDDETREKEKKDVHICVYVNICTVRER